MRYMYDAIRANAKTLIPVDPEMVAIYLTGTPNIRWTSAEVALFPRATFVRIDQGGFTSPQYEANVFDVEPGAWTMASALDAVKKCTAPRPTIYCDRADYHNMPPGYTGDLWIAAPGLTDAEALAFAASDKRIIGVQNTWLAAYDRSVIVDPYWPDKPPVDAGSGLPTGIHYSAFPVTDQCNARCDAVNGPHDYYEWQLELLTVTGWQLVSQEVTTSPLVSFRNLGSKWHYRFRVSKGTWSDWTNFETP